jgi:hypothetical protein
MAGRCDRIVAIRSRRVGSSPRRSAQAADQAAQANERFRTYRIVTIEFVQLNIEKALNISFILPISLFAGPLTPRSVTMMIAAEG